MEAAMAEEAEFVEEQPTEAEQQAKTQGWAPKEEWKGDPNQWVDAETFLEKGEKIRAIQRERNDHLTKEVRELRQLIVEQKDMAKKARLQGYQEALAKIEREQIAATEMADVDAFKAAKDQEKRVLKAIEDESKPEPEANAPAVDHEFEEWKADNPWFDEDKDPYLVDFARAASVRIQAQTGVGGRKLYDEVTKLVKQELPHKFGNPRRNEAGAVESGKPTSMPKKSGKGFDDLPDSAKSSYQKLSKQFKMQGIDYTKEEYLSNYVWD